MRQFMNNTKAEAESFGLKVYMNLLCFLFMLVEQFHEFLTRYSLLFK